MPAEPNPDTQRLFFALWPSPSLQAQLAALAHCLGGRHVVASNLHLTLAFLGQVDGKTRACLEARADTLRVDRFVLTLDRLDCFRRQGLMWADASQLPAPLQKIVDALRAAQAACGLLPETRPFQAHVTLLRKLCQCPPGRAIDPIAWTVDGFVLVRSNLSAKGAKYGILRTWSLG